MPRAKKLITLAVMLSLFLASMEATVVATAMPTIAGRLGGLHIYSWVFSAYMLASTVTVPLFGKLSDQFGRRPAYAAAMTLFLAGSLLCGMAGSMVALIAFRVLQGLGAGGLLTLAFVIVGAMFTLEQRARMQGLFAGVWGVSSVVGPLIGGFLVDRISWPWVFYINLVPGPLALALIWTFWVDDARPADAGPVRVDFAGMALLALSVLALLLGLFQIQTPTGWMLLAAAAGLAAALWRVERRAQDPVLPLRLFRDRLFAAAAGHGLLSGFAMFGGLAFVPLFVQAVLGTSATSAGATLMPLTLGWVSASITGTRLLLRTGYRAMAVAGMISLTAGAFLMSRIGPQSSQIGLAFNMALMGVGMGLSVPSLLIAVQTAVPRRLLGTATSTLQFSRSIGGALGVSVMGAALALGLAASLRAAGMDPAATSLNRLLDPMARASSATALDGALRDSLAGAIGGVFVFAFAAAAAGLLVTSMAPGGRIVRPASGVTAGGAGVEKAEKPDARAAPERRYTTGAGSG